MAVCFDVPIIRCAARLLRTLSAAFLVLGCHGLPAGAQAPEIYMQLGYKTGSEFGMEKQVVFSSDGGLLAAVSGDNLIRVWDTESGRELQTLTGHEGAIDCLAFVPGSRRILSGGHDRTVRLWDIDQGRLIQTFWGHQNQVRWITVSPDGALAASLEDVAVRIWDLSSGALVMTVPAPAESGSSSGHVSPLRYVSFSADSSKVLFNSLHGETTVVGLKERRILRTFTCEQLDSYVMGPFLGFAPDGRPIRAGSPTLIYLDLERGEVSWKKFPQGCAVNFLSPDGSMVAGRIYKNGTNACIQVSDGEGKELRSIPARDDVVSIGYSPAKGQVAIACTGDHLDLYDLATGMKIQDFSAPAIMARDARFSADGNFISLHRQRVVGRHGQQRFENWADHWNLRTATMEKHFSIDAFNNEVSALFKNGDPGSVATASKRVQENSYYEALPDGFSGFDPQNRCFYYVQVVPESLSGGTPFVTIFRIDGSDADDQSQFSNYAAWRVFRKIRAHDQGVTACAVSYGADLLATGGADRTIKIFSFRDQSLVRTLRGHLGPVTGLTFSPDGTRLLSESGDMTSRLWDVATGKELARFILFADSEWIAVTPEGYYNASANGDRHLNVRTGDGVFGIENYREAFFRPDLVRNVLNGGSMQGFQTLAEIHPAPRVSFIQTPTTAAAQDFRVTLKLEDQGGGIGDVRLFLNGSAIVLDSGRGLKVTAAEPQGPVRGYSLKLSPGVNTIRAVAFNAGNTMQSNSASQQVTATFTSAHRPVLHALVVGIQQFRNPKLELKYPAADARLFAEILRRGAQGLFEQVQIKTLTSREDTSRDSLIRALKGYRTVSPDDVFILFLASHGTVDEGEYFLITSNVGPLNTEKLQSDALPQGLLKEMVANIPSTKKLILIDTCNAGQLGKAMQMALLTRGMSEDTAMKVLSRAVGCTILSASTSVQEALEGYQGHGLFTWALAQGMQGKADKGHSGVVQTTALAAYVEEVVPDVAERVFRRAQFPTVSISGQGFPVGKVVQ